MKNRISNLKLVNNAFSDHEKVEFDLSNVKLMRTGERIWKRNWRKYSKDNLLDEQNSWLPALRLVLFLNLYPVKLLLLLML